MRRSVFLFVSLILILIILNFYFVYAQEWSPPVRITDRCMDNAPRLLAIGDTLHVVYEDRQLGWGRYPTYMNYVRSTDAGLNWSTPIHLSSYDEYDRNSTPRIVGYGSNIMCIWFYAFHSERGTYIFSATSTDNGQTWTTPQNILGQNDSMLISVAISNTDDHVNLTASLNLWRCDPLFNIRSTDFGQTWSDPVQITDSVYCAPGIDQVSFGNLVHLVFEGAHSYHEIAHLDYMKSTDDGLTWSDPVDLKQNENDWSGDMSIAVNQAGILGITWTELDNLYMKLNFDNGENWGSAKQITNDGNAALPGDIMIYHDDISVAWVTFADTDGNNSDIFYKRSSDYGQDWGCYYWLDRSFYSSNAPALAESKGKIYAVWHCWS